MTRTLTISAIAVGAVSALGAPVAAAQEPTLKLSGRVQLDYSVLDADRADFDVSAGEARTIRLAVAGDFSSAISYKAELATDSSGEVSATDVYLDFAVANGWELRAGQMKTPNSFDEITSGRFTSTYERTAFSDAFEFDRRIGVQAQRSGERYTFAAGVFGENLESDAADGGTALAARGTYAVPFGEDGLVHLGASARYREQGDDSGLIRYRQRPYAHIPGRVISTGAIADSDAFYGAEAAVIVSRFWGAAEYGVTDADCAACAGGDPTLYGYYLEAGMILGGERTYKGGRFDRPKVDAPLGEGGSGAWSFVARLDSIDQRDGGVDGGELDTLVLGADWWPTAYSRLGINAFWNDVSYGASTSGLDPAFAQQVVAGTESDDVSGVTVRLQFDF